MYRFNIKLLVKSAKYIYGLHTKKECNCLSGRYIITLNGESDDAINIASKEIEQIIKAKNISVTIISNLNGLVDNMKNCKHTVIINKCYGFNSVHIKKLATFILDPIWEPLAFYVSKKYITDKNKIKKLGVNQIYSLNNSQKNKINQIYFFFKCRLNVMFTIYFYNKFFINIKRYIYFVFYFIL